jgi:hypothetical protein
MLAGGMEMRSVACTVFTLLLQAVPHAVHAPVYMLQSVPHAVNAPVYVLQLHRPHRTWLMLAGCV